MLVTAGATQVGLNLRALGFGASLRAVGAVAPRISSGRVVYARKGLSEWYSNGPLGIEQGFTVPRAPAGQPAGPLTLSMALSGDAEVALAPNGQSLTLAHAGGPPIHYGGLTVSDARGRALHSWVELHAGGVLLRVDTRGARYPVRIDPFFQDGGKVTGSGESGEGDVGYAVALSSDGATALVGGFSDDGGVGAAWVFTRSGSTWTQQGEKLTGSGESGAGEFGISVALSSDGNTALIGGWLDNEDVGAAWVFTRSGSTWSQQGSKLTGSGESGKGVFGVSVALSAEGNTALIGGQNDNTYAGAAWAFTRSGSTWTQQGEKLTGGGEVGKGEFGQHVALSSTGDTALIAGSSDNGYVGAAWVFTRSGSTWTQQGEKLVGSGGYESEFATSVALSAEGNTALIGGGHYFGAAWVFTRSGSTWTQQARLTGSGESGYGLFGVAVALSSNGDTALIGGFGDNEHVGAAWVFTRSGSTWTQQGSKLTGAGESGEGDFALSVALSAEGNIALIGGPYDNSSHGAVWSFVTSLPVETSPEGNWVGAVGHDGYDLAGWNKATSDLADMPDASVTLVHGSRYLWEGTSGTTDKRALKSPEGSSREVAAYYDPEELILKLSFKEAYTGELHLYALDWDSTERREIITVDGKTALLNESFHEGAWVSVPIEVSAGGSVTINVEHTGGSNAVLSGIFLGGEGSPPSLPVETSPQGNWVGEYGHEGYDLAGWDNATSDLADIPAASVTLVHGSRYLWEGTSGTTDKRALKSPEGSSRKVATYYDPEELVLKLSFKEAYTGELHLYALDWDTTGRRERIAVDGQTALLNESFHEGAWVSVPIEVSAGGSVTITIEHTGGENAVLSGIFLGGSGEPTSLPVETVPQGNWVGEYGHEGYDLAGWNNATSDLADIPAASVTLVHGSRYLWAGTSGTTDKRALKSPEGSSRKVATYYDPEELVVKLSFKEAYAGQLHLYALDWDTTGRRETITVDGQTALLDESFHEGAWVSVPIEVSAGASVTITVEHTGGENAVLSGIFLGEKGAPPAPSLLIPAYFNPGYEPGKAAWPAMCEKSAPPGSIIVANPDSGPYTKAYFEEQGLAEAIETCQEKGYRVVGYVPTDEAKETEIRPAGEKGEPAALTEPVIKDEIAQWYKIYPALNGIFFDQYSNEAGTEPFYAALQEKVQTEGGGSNDFVVANPGVPASSGWQLNVANLVVASESTLGEFETRELPSWIGAAKQSRIAVVVHNAATLGSLCNAAAADNAGTVFVTNWGPGTSESNEYGKLPTYFSEEVADC